MSARLPHFEQFIIFFIPLIILIVSVALRALESRRLISLAIRQIANPTDRGARALALRAIREICKMPTASLARSPVRVGVLDEY